MNLLTAWRGAVAGLVALAFGVPVQGAGDVSRGAQVARTCLGCHSLIPGRHLTGPSLAGVPGRKAGTVDGFSRYSDALKRSGITWDEQQLDAWLENPAALVPGNYMGFPGIKGAASRIDLIAYLEAVRDGRVAPPDRGLPDLKHADDASRVTAISQCADAYRVTTADGETLVFWEFNLRFKTDGSASGPGPGQPVIVGSGMQGDRASVVFSRLEEIPGYVRRQCP